ncbi:MAG TPA: VWA domain-containing protein [Vicinamibacteria bacterium]|nr:VWA domain-containing protein [Vicinamibacteria bacterium]
MSRTRAGALAGSLLFLSTLAALAAAQKAPVFQGGVEMVNVTVTAHDGRGNLVSDLTAQDFTVKEDGRTQNLQLFAASARQVHAGERSPVTGELRCTRCSAVLHVATGQTVPPCPEGHRTFDVDSQQELSLNLGMLFDTSESMRKEIKLSQESAIRFLDAIPRAKDLLLIFFDRDIRISRYNSENQQGIFERILGTEGSGYTALNDSIAVYLSRVVDTPGRKVLVLFSDGDDTTSRLNAGDVEQLLRGSDVVVYTVAFAGERPHSEEGLRAQSFLAMLAEVTGGRVFKPRASKELAAIYQSILDELGSQYVIGYVSDNPARDGRFRKLLVEVKRPGLKLRYRPGYSTPRDQPAKR